MKYYIGKIQITEEEWLERYKKRIKLDNAYTSDPRSAKSAMDIEIETKGGIVDNMGKIHTTAQSYKNHLKDNNLVIRDWTHGTLNKQKFKGCEMSDIPNLK